MEALSKLMKYDMYGGEGLKSSVFKNIRRIRRI